MSAALLEPVSPSRKLAGERLVVCRIDSPLGPLVAGATDEGLCLLEFSDETPLDGKLLELEARRRMRVVAGMNAHLKTVRDELAGFFAGSLRTFTAPLVLEGTPFQNRVWQALCKIPYGATCSYEDIAVAVGTPKAVRAVGQANGLNRIAIIIPCHRVINKGGKLGGYGGGLDRKRWLLDLESAR